MSRCIHATIQLDEVLHVALEIVVLELEMEGAYFTSFPFSEGRCFVLAVGLMMAARDLPPELKSASETQRQTGDWLERGGSATIGPDTRYVVEPVLDREELSLPIST